MKINFLVAQLESNVGEFELNYKKIKNAYLEAEKKDCDFFVSTELALSGYPPKDLLLRDDFIKTSQLFLQRLEDLTKHKKCHLCVGTPFEKKGELFNSLMILKNGKIIQRIDKTILPNYGVFDEKRYFKPSRGFTNLLSYKKRKICFLVCEDFWNNKFVEKVINVRPDVIVVVNASPFEKAKYQERIKLAKNISEKSGSMIIYSNLSNAQDDLIFDGGSFCMLKNKKIINQAPFFQESKLEICFPSEKQLYSNEKNSKVISNVYMALVYSLRKYLKRTGFKKVLIGISGGIDSVLCATIACDSIGSKNVLGYILPSKYTSAESILDSKKLAENLNMKLTNLNIEDIINLYKTNLKPIFKDLPEDLTEENLQSRIRGVLLMALSNKFNQLLIATGNKSELAVGYSTLYGDMCGGFSLLKDVYKTEVFELANWRNINKSSFFLLKKKKLIPKNIIVKEPTAELKENQKDSDSLPPYDILDKILNYLIDQELSVKDILDKGFKKELINKVWVMLKKSEFKRYQSSIGPKISKMNFDNDRRFPIVNDYKL